MTENEAIERIIRSACSSGKCYDACLYGEGNCEYDAAIIALKEVQQYREIGTVEECRKAVERRKPKRAVFDCMIGNWDGRFNCPACGKVILRDCGDVENTFCERCGQAIRWG